MKTNTKYKKQENSNVIYLCGKQHDMQKMNATFNGWNSHITMDGNEFHGEYVNGMPNGKGGIFMEEELCYLGYFKDGMLSGSGVFWFPSGEFYRGNFKENNQHGHGIFYCADGDKYSGQFRNGYPNGKGCWIKVNGDKYVGQFKDGEYHGRGYEISGAIVTTGIWEEGELVEGDQWVQWDNNAMFKIL